MNAAGDGQDFDLVHARLLRFFPELVEELGGSLPGLLASAEVGMDTLAGDAPGITYRQAIHLMELAAQELDCPDFGMRLAEKQSGGGAYGPLGQVMRNSKSFGDALTYVSRHSYAHSLAARVWLRRLPSESAVFSGHDILLDNIANRAQAMEQILLIGHLEAMELTGGYARARRVHFRHQPVSASRDYRRYFGCEVRFGEPADGLVFSERDLACPIADPDADAFADVTAYIDRHFTRHRPPLHAETRGVIMRRLASGQCTNEAVAGELNLHLRTLHRRLRAEGTSFQQVKDEVRRDVMLYYVRQTTLDFARISEMLGFAEQSIMTRRCNRWFSMSPTRLREEEPQGNQLSSRVRSADLPVEKRR
ncbi:MAG: AraC family transcriptional regulator ligand-binding domain-containing protein [Novosphingobium sp.]|nr:AraC family transcriptional regulator ligand-binding domain-containing protein [Novosphingobium sp.]